MWVEGLGRGDKKGMKNNSWEARRQIEANFYIIAPIILSFKADET